MGIVACHLSIEGFVQGVFFRSTLRNVAMEHNVVGWVRNLENGNVEAFVQGEEHDVNRIVEWCKHGPRGAVVDVVRIEAKQPDENLRSFSIVI